MKHTKITERERQLLAFWLDKAVAKKECARRLGRDIKTIRREIARNSVRVKAGVCWKTIYEPCHAQNMAEERKQNAWRAKQPLKNKRVYSYALKMLRRGWSPEQIAGRLTFLHPNDKNLHICYETIYQFIYKEKTDLLEQGIQQQTVRDKRRVTNKKLITVTDYPRPLWEYLRRKQTKRRRRSGRKVHRVRIPDRVSIHKRPEEITNRKEFGHWEGDSLVGKGRVSGLHTEYERVSSIIRFKKMHRLTTDEFVQAATKIFSRLPERARKSTTLDNGLEHVKHGVLKERYSMDTYFADPYSAWQRGGNENANLWIRYYFPKGTDFSTITNEELKDVEQELNNRPRKRLGFKTPREEFKEQLNLP